MCAIWLVVTGDCQPPLWNSWAYQEQLSVRFEFQNLEKRSSDYVVVERGVPGRVGAMRATAPSMSPRAFPRQGRQMPTPRACAAGANGTNMRLV